jgi:hypothetical protein
MTRRPGNLSLRQSNNEFAPTGFSKKAKALAVSLVLLGLGLGLAERARVGSAKIQKERPITVKAEGRGKGLLRPKDGRELNADYSGDSSATEALKAGSAQPLSLATGDFNRDGAPT